MEAFKSEQKTQAVEELARDPHSNVSSSDVEKVIMDESKKAGAVALSFDPNASPEEKAAQARAVGAVKEGLKFVLTACRSPTMSKPVVLRKQWA
jgi:hypothetical protein